MRAPRSFGRALRRLKSRSDIAAPAPSTAAADTSAHSHFAPLAKAEQILHYEIQAKLGEGGMGVVYKALDQKLNRYVALKFLPPHIDGSGLHFQRFLQEANVLSALNHPHIATIYAVETAGDRQFLSLEFLPGGTLKAKLQQSAAALSFENVLKYGQQAAEGLAHAHARGIIHRDVKTSNLMLTEEGELKLTDFGIAKLTGSSLSTTPGGLIGTIPYMSPEQALGLEVDERSDIFSLGVVLFELATGRLPFEAPNDAALLTRITSTHPPRLTAVRTDAPTELERIVERALKKRLESRYASVEELLTDLRELKTRSPGATRSSTRNQLPTPTARRKPKWVVGLVGVMIAAVAGGSVVLYSKVRWRTARPGQSPSAGASTTRSPPKQASYQLAVLPFRYFGPDPANDTLAEEVTRALRDSLGGVEFGGELSVLSSADGLRGTKASPLPGDVRARANLLLAGVVIQDRELLTFAATLRDPKERLVVNATEVQGPTDQLGQLQESLRQNVAEILHTKIRAADGPRELSKQGRGYLQRYDRIQNLENAISLFDKALQLDSTYAPAHAARAEAYVRHYRLSKDATSLERANASLTAALQTGQNLGQTYFARGLYRAATGDELGAVESLQESLRIDATSDPARELANQYDALNRLEEAQAMYLRAISLRPAYWAGYKDLATFYQKHLRLQDALPLFERVAQLAPDDHSSYTNLFGVYYKLKMYSEAAEALEAAVAIDPSALTYYQLGTMRYLEGRFPEAIQAYEKSLKLNPNDAATWGALGDAARFVKGRADVVAEAYQHAVALKEGELRVRPRDARLRAQIADWLILSNKKRALREIRKALALKPDDSYVQVKAALVYEQSRMRDKAIAALEAAVRLGYSVAEIQGWPPLEELRQDPRYKRVVTTVSEHPAAPVSHN